MKVIKTSEFDFSRFDDNRAVVNVKVGALESSLNVSLREDGDGIEVVSVDPTVVLENLEKAVGKLDYTDIVLAFTAARDKAKAERKLRERAMLTARWDEHWVHKAKKVLRNSDVSLRFPEREKYVDAGNLYLSVNVSYKNHLCSITKEDGAYILSGGLTGYRRRRYKTITSLAKRYIDIVDTKIRAEERDKKLKESRSAENHIHLMKLIDLFGENIVQEAYTYRDRVYVYTEQRWYYKFNDNRVRIVANRDFDTFTFGSISGLSANQVRAIIKIAGGEVD